MSSELITRDTLDKYLKEVAREIRREYGKQADVELILVGGAAILTTCHFRDSTMDIDALILSRSSIKDIINRIGDQFGLQNGWLNQDFKKTSSYSLKLREYSQYYRSYLGVLQVRTMPPEYIVAMKLVSFRPYKNDQSDIAGVLAEYPMSAEIIEKAFFQLYPEKEISLEARTFLQDCLDGKIRYEEARIQEYENKVILQRFDADYEKVLKEDNLKEILSLLKARKGN